MVWKEPAMEILGELEAIRLNGPTGLKVSNHLPANPLSLAMVSGPARAV
jgi:hypothetical protein